MTQRCCDRYGRSTAVSQKDEILTGNGGPSHTSRVILCEINQCLNIFPFVLTELPEEYPSVCL